MRSFFTWLSGLFGRSKEGVSAKVDHLPGERARHKGVGTSAQEQAWRKVSSSNGSARSSQATEKQSDFDKLLRK